MFWLVIPAAVIAFTLILYPVGYALSLTFMKLDTIVSPPEFAGFSNYIAVLTDGEFWRASFNGLVYAGLTIVLQLVLGVGIAIVLNQRFRGRAFLRSAIIMPYVVPTVAGVFLFRWMLDENSGVIDSILQSSLGISIGWFSDPGVAMYSVVMISVWLWTPFVVVSVLAALGNIPHDLYEAASLDGSGVWQRFWHVTLPGIRSILVIVALLRGIWTFNKFDVIQLATGGGPLGSTEHLPVLAYKVAFGTFDLSRGATIAAVNMLMILLGVLLYLRLTKRWIA